MSISCASSVEFLSSELLRRLRRSSHCWMLEMVGLESREWRMGAIRGKKECLKEMYYDISSKVGIALLVFDSLVLTLS